MIPTKRLWLVLGVGIVFSAVAAQAGLGTLMWGFDGLVLLLVFVSSYFVPKPSEIAVEREMDPVFSVRSANRVKLKVENSSVWPLRGTVLDEPEPIFSSSNNLQRIHIEPGDTEELTYKTTPPLRGNFRFLATFFRIRCPLGLVDKQLRIDSAQGVRVYPNLQTLQEFDLLNQRGKLKDMGLRRNRMRGLGTEFESLRDYCLGDDFRKIDWKATARRGKPIVKQFEVERNQSVMLVIDCGRSMLGEVNDVTKLDYSLDSCLLLARAAFSMGDQVGLLVYNDSVQKFISPRKSNNQIGVLIESVHDLQAEPVESNPASALSHFTQRWKKRSLVVLFTDVSDADKAQVLAKSLGALRHRHVVIVVNVNDPEIQQLTETVPQTKQDLYGQAAGLWLEERQLAAIGILKAAHVHHVAAEPQDLSKALVEAYFDIKERALI